MKVDPLNNTQISFPTRKEDTVFKKPDLTSDNYVQSIPQDIFISSKPYDTEEKKPILKITIRMPNSEHRSIKF